MARLAVRTKAAVKRVSASKRTPYYFGTFPYKKVETFSAALLRTIKSDLATAIFFTREDIISSTKVFDHVSTIYRYSLICATINFLVQKGDLIAKNRTDLCLAGQHANAYSELPLSEQHYDTIRGVIRKLRGRRLRLMDIVDAWGDLDPYLTINNKRVAVRTSIARLVKEGVLRRLDDFEFFEVGGSPKQASKESSRLSTA